jgi:F0F1-type ATP synthase delta subunit
MNIDQLSNLFLEKEKNMPELYSLVRKYKLEFLLPAVIKNLEKKNSMIKDRKRVVLEVPFDTTQAVISEIESKYKEKISDVKVKKDIIFGFKLKTQSKVIDSSLKALFNNFIK